MKQYLLSSLSFLLAMSLSAKCVVFTLSDGSKAYYQIGGESNPVMHLTDEGVTVMADSYTFGQIQNFRISEADAPQSLCKVNTDGSYHWQAGSLVVPAADVTLLDLSGRVIGCPRTLSAGTTILDLQSLPAGTYLVRIGNSTLKVSK